MNNPTKTVLLDSGLFTQVEPAWLEESQGYCTMVNKSRGVVAIVHVPKDDHRQVTANTTARMFFDVGLEESYYSSGWYDVEELEKWVFPIMKSDSAWNKYCEFAASGNGDLTLALDYV